MDKLTDNISEDFENNSLNGMTISGTKRKKGEGCCKHFLRHLTEFCKNTKVYGFNYLSDPKTIRLEKLYWLIFIFISFYFAINTTVHLWTKWNESPLLVFAQNHKSVWEVPFPAITICPETKIRQTVYNFTDYYHKVINSEAGEGNLTLEEMETFSDMSLFCDNHLHISGKPITDFKTVHEHLTNVSPPFHRVFFGCKWSSFNESCDNLFIPSVTEDGLCFTFNMLNKKEFLNGITFSQDHDIYDHRASEGWTLDKGYSKNVGKNAYPRRTATVGTKGGLFVLLKSFDHDVDYVCRGPVEGFKIAVHQPSEIPKISTEYFRAPLNKEVVIAVKPNLITTAPDLKSYNPHQRQCFFSEEKKLKFFRTYDQQNCRTECLANFTLNRCGCVPYHMPREENTKICGSGNTLCMFEAEQELLIRETEHDISTFDFESENFLCNCLPGCTLLRYTAEISQADLNWKKVLQGFKTTIDDFSRIKVTRLTIFFKDSMHFSSNERNRLYGKTEFLAQCGGLLAFFCGFSFLTLAEIVYFLLLGIIRCVKKFVKRF